MTPPPAAAEAPAAATAPVTSAAPAAAAGSVSAAVPNPAPVVWPALAEAMGLRVETDGWGLQASMQPAASVRQLAEGFVAPLTDLGLLNVVGDDALRFLHGQLTNDVEHLSADEARWYGYCTAKGRLLSTSLGWRDGDGVALTVSRPMAETLRKRLAMFVLRAKARVVDASEERLLLGLGGAAAAGALERLLGAAPPAPMAVLRSGGACAVGLPPVSLAGEPCPRWLLSLPPAQAAAILAAACRPRADGPPAGTTAAAAAGMPGAVSRVAGAANEPFAGALPQAADREAAATAAAPGALVLAGSDTWRWTEVLAGVPRIVAGAAEHFVPQMLNLDVSGGVSFTKGCYPGQEVVARTHYLGKQRRRMYLGHVDAAVPAAGADVLDGAGAPVGRVVLAAPCPLGGADLLFECQITAAAGGTLSTGTQRIAPGELPYALPQ